MIPNRSGLFRSGFLMALVLLGASAAAAQSYKVEKADTPPPQELSAAVRKTLSPEAMRVLGPNGPLCELWLRRVVPAKAAAAQDLGISYQQLVDGTLVGAVRFLADVKDFRRQRVRPGVYTLRYALVPVNDVHYGVAPNRDFLLLSPAAADADPATISRDVLLNLSRRAAGTSHPSVWSLPTADTSQASLPALTHQEDADLWVLQFAVEMQTGSAAPARIPMALVVVGSAPEA